MGFIQKVIAYTLTVLVLWPYAGIYRLVNGKWPPYQ